LNKLSGQGVAVLMATHDLFRAKESGTRVGIMKHGRLVAQLRTEEIGQTDLENIYYAIFHIAYGLWHVRLALYRIES
jgi:ABC-2 type transport system ATP-binding protein